MEETDDRCVRYALVGAYWNDRSSVLRLDEVLAPIALTEREIRLLSFEKLESDGIFVSECTLEWRLFVVSCDTISDCRRSEELLGSVREIDLYSPPTGWCIPIGWI